MRTRAAIVENAGAPAVVTSVDVDAPGPGDVLVEVAACGVCRSDRHEQTGQGLVAFPVVLGHEAAGVVLEVGSEVKDVAPGDHVVLSWTPECGGCPSCQREQPAYCVDMQPSPGTGHLARDGAKLNSYMALAGFARHAVVPERAAVKIRDDVPLDVVCTIGCGVMTGYGASVYAGGVGPGDRVLVLGCGGVGLGAIQGARIAGASEIIAVDRHPERLEIAKTVGATTAISAGDSGALGSATGEGVDVAVEAVGRTDVIVEAMAATRSGGTTVTVGLPPLSDQLQLPPLLLLMGRTLKGSVYGDAAPRRDFPKLVDEYASGALRLDELVTARYPLERVNDALEAIEEPGTIRSVITMSDGA